MSYAPPLYPLLDLKLIFYLYPCIPVSRRQSSERDNRSRALHNIQQPRLRPSPRLARERVDEEA